MKTLLRRIEEKEKEQVIIECVKVTAEIKDICAYIQSKGEELTGWKEDYIKKFKLEEVFYFEGIDKKVFAYTKNDVYEIKMRLYEIEEAFANQHFIRCSKSIVINLMRLDKISPSLNGRFFAHMKNGEKVIVSRQYVKKLKQEVFGGAKG